MDGRHDREELVLDDMTRPVILRPSTHMLSSEEQSV